MNKFRFLTSLLILGFAINSAHAQEPGDRTESSKPVEAIEKRLSELVKENKLPGIVAAYQRIGSPMMCGASGVRKADDPEKITVEDQLHLGSCTKAMTATLIGRLVERKLLTWDTTIASGLPVLSKGFHKDYHGVTVKQLLIHRGGIVANPSSWHEFKNKKTVTQTRRAIAAKALAKKPRKPVGTYVYSNLGYMVAGLIANKATGKPWETMMKEEIFGPLKLKSAGFGAPGTKGKVDQPWGHSSTRGKRNARQGDNAPALGPAGTVHMSISDWTKFGLQHIPVEGTANKSDVRLVSNETLAILHKPLPDATGSGKDYALGWNSLERSWGGNVLTHSGSNTMWFATIWISAKNKTVYVAVCNSASSKAKKATDNIFGTLIKLEKESR